MRSTVLGFSRLPYLVQILLLAGLYFAAAQFGFRFAVLPGNVTAFWLPSGIALAALLLSTRLVPGIALGAFLTEVSTGVPLTFGFAATIGNTLEAIVGAYLLRQLHFGNTMKNARDILALVGLAAGGSTLISATFGVTGLCLSGAAPWEEFYSIWVVWWLGDAIGVLVAAPFLLIWATDPQRQLDRTQTIQAAILLVAVSSISWAIFASPFFPPGEFSPVYFTFPFLVWASVRFGQREVVTITTLVSIIAVWGTTQNLGPFVDGSIQYSEVMLLGYIATLMITAMLLTSTIARRRNTEAALRASEERFSKAFNSNHSSITITRLEDGLMLDANRRFEDIFGYKREEVIGRAIPAFNLWADPNLRVRLIEMLREGKSVHQVESRFRKKSGETVDGLISLELIEIGGVAHLLGMFDDMTERIQSEETLKRQEQFLRQVIDANPHPIFVKDSKGRFTLANKALAETLGTTVENMMGKTDADLNPNAEEVAHYMADDQEVLKTLQPKFILEEPATYANGELHWHQAIKIPLISPEGERQILGVGLDITERKRAEEALRLSEERFSQAFHASPSPILITRLKDGLFIDVNDSFLEVSGYTRDEVIGHTVSELNMYPASERQPVIQRVLEGSTVRNFENQMRSKSGELRHLLLAIESFEQGDEEYLLTMFQDITERKAKEEAVRQLNIELEQRVAERTAELTAANERLKELDRLKSKFIADVSHELRNPLTALSTRLYLLERTMQGTQSEYLSSLKEHVERLKNFVEHVLDLSRLEAKIDTVQFEMVDLNEVTAQVVDAMAAQAEVAGLNLTFNPDQQMPPIPGVYNQLTQIVTNLVANAINYTNAGKVEVTTAADFARNSGYLRVSDTGIGISEADLPHLFERFYRSQHVVQSNIPGSGLGLGIVKEITDLHGGKIEVQSVVGKGSTFTVTFPLRRLPILGNTQT